MTRPKASAAPRIADPPKRGSRVYSAPIDPSVALGSFIALTGDVDNLLARHANADGKAGKPSTDEAPLSRAAVLIMYAAWEVYFEESLIEAVDRIASLSLSLLPQATKDYLKRYVGGDPWALAGDGWRDALREQVALKVRGASEGGHGVNDASPAVIISLQESILGTSPFADVRWNNQSPEQIQDRLDAFINLRGEIAHTGRTAKKIWHGEIKTMVKFVAKVAREADYRLMLWLSELEPTTVHMWNTVRGVLDDWNWHTGQEVRSALGVPAGEDSRKYREVNAFLARCAEEDLLARRRAGRGFEFSLLPPDLGPPPEWLPEYAEG